MIGIMIGNCLIVLYYFIRRKQCKLLIQLEVT